MSRVTPPKAVNKIAQSIRSISSSAQASRPSALLSSTARTHYLPQRLSALKAECNARNLKTSGSKAELVDRLTAHDLTRSHSSITSSSTLGGHRPSVLTHAQLNASLYRTGSLMQGFRTSAPAAMRLDASTIDYFTFPELEQFGEANPNPEVRVPLMPDNYEPDRSRHAVEFADEAVPRPEVLIVAANPDQVIAATITEVVGNEAVEDNGSLGAVVKMVEEKVEELKEPGLLMELWEGLMDDLFGPKKSAVAH